MHGATGKDPSPIDLPKRNPRDGYLSFSSDHPRANVDGTIPARCGEGAARQPNMA